MVQLQANELYHERSFSIQAVLYAVMYLGISIIFFIEYFIQDHSYPGEWAYTLVIILAVLFFAASLFVMFNYTFLNIQFNTRGITISFGLLKITVRWDNIQSYHLDSPRWYERSKLFDNGMIRQSWKDEGKAITFHTQGNQTVLLELKEKQRLFHSWYRFVGFTTKNPHLVVEYILQRKR